MTSQRLPTKPIDDDGMLFLTMVLAISAAGLEWVWPILF